MNKYILPAILLIIPELLSAQTVTGDSILAVERSIDRPVTLHAHQIRITGGYGLSILSRRFDSSKDIVRLSDETSSSLRHRFAFDIRYGITDFIQFNAAIGYSTNIVRDKTGQIFPLASEPVVSHKTVHEYRGFEDLYLGVDLRAPLKTRKIDLALTLAATLPIASFEPARPEHTFEVLQENGASVHNFAYHYNYPLGKGVSIAQIGGIIKYRTTSWAISARVDYQHALKDGSSFEWRHQLNDGSFEYQEHPNTYRLPDANTYYVEGEYQIRRRLDLFMIVLGYTSFNGWTSSQADIKVATPYQHTWVLSPGVEIIITPKLWLRERINFPVAGKNYEAPFSFQTTVMYNFFP